MVSLAGHFVPNPVSPWFGRTRARSRRKTPFSVHTRYDNLGRSVWTKTYASADFTLSADELRAQINNLYDGLGRLYESRLYEVDPLDGTVGDYLPTKTWYDARGYTVKTASANGLFQKNQYDGLGRLVVSFTSFDLDEEDYEEALDVAGDTVIQQTRTWYDPAGNPLATATYQRLPDDTSTTGALTGANSYATAAVTWYDPLGRTVAAADYGREDAGSSLTHYFFDGSTGALIDTNSNGIPDIAEDSPPEPYPQDPNSLAGIDFQLQLVQYDSAGRAYRTIDNLGRIHQTDYDDAGRTVRTIQNYDDGEVDETDTDQDLTVEYQYDSAGRLVSMTAYNPKGTGNGVQAQATKYLYTSPINASWQTAVVYPDSTDELSQNQTTKVWTITEDNGDHVSTAYDRLGRVTSTIDQRGVEHTYLYDSAGRLAHDCVTDLGTSGIVDDAILRITKTYDDIGRVQTVTSHDEPEVGQGNVVNQVEYAYNGWGRLAREYQEHDGAVDGNTPYVQYDYEDGASGGVARYVRLWRVSYPNGRSVGYSYGAAQAVDDIMSRLGSIFDDTDGDRVLDPGEPIYAAYKYLGQGRIVEEDYATLGVRLSYDPAGDNSFSALDRFGRVVDQIWLDYGSNPDVVLDHYTYTYDRAGNRTSRANELHSAFDEEYTYDGLDRLTDADRADQFDQSWGLDGLGNFSTFDDDGSSQTRTTNGVNEITGITGGWITPSYDAAGNMTSGPEPGNETTRVHYVYDAWNRLVAGYTDDGDGTFEPGTDDDLVASYEYDGTNRRIEKAVTETGAGPRHVHYFSNQDWQLLEERFVDGEGTATAINQYVWSARYIDAPVVRFHDGNADGDLLDAEDNIRYYTTDANYNVTATIDAATGDVVERYVYTAYGKATVYDEDWANPAAPAIDGPLYCGYFFDAETGLYQVRNRYYDSSLSTFISRDPIGGINLYKYVGNSPLMRIDPFGLKDHPVTVTLPDGTKCTANCAEPDPPKGGGPAIPCRESDLKPSCDKKCQSAVANAQNDPGVKKLLDQIRAMPGCAMPRMECRDCGTGNCKAGGWHMGNSIYICDGQGHGAVSLLEHELTHHLQDCRNQADVSCADRMKMEVEANLAAGKTFAQAFADAVWSSCITQRCKVSDITDTLAQQMWNAFPPPKPPKKP